MYAKKCMYNAMQNNLFFLNVFAYGKLQSTAVENEALCLSAAEIEQLSIVQISSCSALCIITYHLCKNDAENLCRALCTIFVPCEAPFQGVHLGY